MEFGECLIVDVIRKSLSPCFNLHPDALAPSSNSMQFPGLMDAPGQDFLTISSPGSCQASSPPAARNWNRMPVRYRVSGIAFSAPHLNRLRKIPLPRHSDPAPAGEESPGCGVRCFPSDQSQSQMLEQKIASSSLIHNGHSIAERPSAFSAAFQRMATPCRKQRDRYSDSRYFALSFIALCRNKHSKILATFSAAQRLITRTRNR